MVVLNLQTLANSLVLLEILNVSEFNHISDIKQVNVWFGKRFIDLVHRILDV